MTYQAKRLPMVSKRDEFAEALHAFRRIRDTWIAIVGALPEGPEREHAREQLARVRDDCRRIAREVARCRNSRVFPKVLH